MYVIKDVVVNIYILFSRIDISIFFRNLERF